MDLLPKVESDIAARALLKDGERVIIAVSGGVDSMVLLELFTRLAAARSLQLVAAHFNHQLRGHEGDLDESFVQEQAEARQIAFYSSSADVRGYAQEHGLSTEMAARTLRHGFFAALAESLAISKVALAHHANDQVENLWLRLLRGSPSEGISGMRWLSPSPASHSITLVRPLLGLRRSEIETFARAENIPFRQDATNESSDFLRNRIRLELLPFVERHFQPAITETSLRLIEVLGAEKDWLGQQALVWLRTRAPAFGEVHPALQRAIIHRQLLELGATPSFELIEHLRLQPEVRISIGREEQLLRSTAGELRLERIEEREFNSASVQLHVQGSSGTLEFGGLEMGWAISSERTILRAPGRELFDADQIGGAITLRHWQPGDSFQPIGMSRPIKLQDIFTNLKIPNSRRRELVLAQGADSRIFWVESLRISEHAKVTPATRTYLHWSWSPSRNPKLQD